MNGGFEASATAWGVPPEAQNTGPSPARAPTESPQSGLLTSAMPTAEGSPTCTGAPCAFGKRADAVAALEIIPVGIGRIETTIGPWNRPAGRHAMEVFHIATFLPSSMWRIGMPASSRAHSKVNEHP